MLFVDDIVHQLNAGRSHQDDKDAGKNKQDQGKDHFHRSSLSFLFGHLTSLRPHTV